MDAGFRGRVRGGDFAGLDELFEFAELILEQLARGHAEELAGNASHHAGGGRFEFRAPNGSTIGRRGREANTSRDYDAAHWTPAPAKLPVRGICADLDA